jgi:hypothetical protein
MRRQLGVNAYVILIGTTHFDMVREAVYIYCENVGIPTKKASNFAAEGLELKRVIPVY